MDLHGGNIYRLKREGKGELLDYSSNINPLGVPEILKKMIIQNFDVLEKYPDIDYVELRDNLGRYNGVDSDNIVVGNGATEILFSYIKALKPQKAMVVAPTFAEYTRALASIHCDIQYYILDKNTNFELNIDEFLNMVDDCELVILCNPNNPTGKFIPLEKIKQLNDSLKKKNIRLFIDEAFIEFVENWKDKSAINLRDENIFVMRALTKFFAIPGLRLGYGIGYDKEIMRKIYDIKEPWSVNSFAELAGKNIIWDKEYIELSEKWIKEEKKYFYEKLSTIEEIIAYKTEVNFILLELKSIKSSRLREKMIEKGIVIRDASNFIGLGENFVRLAIKDRQNNDKVFSTLVEEVRK